MTKKIRVLAVDDHPLLREGIAAVIDGEDDIELVAEATTGEEAIDLFRLHRPDVTLMDLLMKAMKGCDGLRWRLLIERDIQFVSLPPVAHVHGALGHTLQAFCSELGGTALRDFREAAFKSVDRIARQHHRAGIIAHRIREQNTDRR